MTLPQADAVGDGEGMPRVRDVLDRFRPAGAPGQATAAGVPADRRAAVADELEPIFAELAATVSQCRELRGAAETAAAAQVAQAGEQARTVIARARADGDSLRAAATAAARAQAEADTSQRLAAAQAEAADVRGRSAAHHAESVARVLDRVRADLQALLHEHSRETERHHEHSREAER